MNIRHREPKQTQMRSNKKKIEFGTFHPCISSYFSKMKHSLVIKLRQAMNAKLNSNSSSKNNIFEQVKIRVRFVFLNASQISLSCLVCLLNR